MTTTETKTMRVVVEEHPPKTINVRFAERPHETSAAADDDEPDLIDRMGKLERLLERIADKIDRDPGCAYASVSAER